VAGAPLALQAAIEGRPVERPLLAPLLAALAAEVEQLDVRGFLADAGKRSRILADLARSMQIDVLVLDSGSGWDAEAAGLETDWTGGYPPSLAPSTASDLQFEAARGGAPVILELLRRAAVVVPETTSLAVTVTGPAALAAATGGSLTLTDAVRPVLAAARAVAEAGAGVVIIREDATREVDADGYAAATAPLWGSLRFFRSAGVLHVHGGADRWAGVLTRAAPFLSVFNPARSPGVAEAIRRTDRCFGVALPARPTTSVAELLATGRCALLTHDVDLAGHVSVRDALAVVRGMSE
jgi:hypothetical protein